MAYNRLIPQATDLISNSQAQLLANFQAIDSGITGTGVGFSRNHVTMSDTTNGGLHFRVDFYQNQGSDPSISGFVSSLYPKSVSGLSELFFNNGTTISQLTNLTVTVSGSNYGCTTPWGLKLNWGSFNVASSVSTTTVTFAVPFTTLQSLVTGISTTNSATVYSINCSASASSFVARSPAGAVGAYYFAIGV